MKNKTNHVIARIFDIINNNNIPTTIFGANLSPGKLNQITVSDFIRFSNALSTHLINAGISTRDTVVTLSQGCLEWNITDHAVMSIGAIHVSITPTYGPEQLNTIFSDVQPAYIMVEHPAYIETISKCAYLQQKNIPISIFKKLNPATNNDFYSIISRPVSAIHLTQLEEKRKSVSDTDIALISYTSGTSEKLKGVIHTHQGMVDMIKSVSELYSWTGFKALSFLPINYLYERLFNYVYQYSGVPILYANRSRGLEWNLLQPEVNCCALVPELIYSLNTDKFAAAMNNLKRLKYFFCSGAPLQNGIVKNFLKTGIEIYEHYGSTETLIVAINSPKAFRADTSGKVLFTDKIRLDSDHQLYYKAPMQGYFKNTSLNKESITADGYYKTNDVVEIDEDNYLKVKGRINEMFKKASGVYVNPNDIENNLLSTNLIAYTVVSASDEKNLHAVIVPKMNVTDEKIIKAVEKYNKLCSKDYMITDYKIVRDHWSLETGELTANNKVKRSFIINKYKK